MGNDVFSDAEMQAMRDRSAEVRAAKGTKGSAKRERESEACLEAIGALTGLDRAVAQMLHLIVLEEAPHLDAKTWYGFPAYARGGKVVVFLQPASKFSTRYPTVGFSEEARLDEGDMWATSFAIVEASQRVEDRLRELVRDAAAAPAN